MEKEEIPVLSTTVVESTNRKVIHMITGICMPLSVGKHKTKRLKGQWLLAVKDSLFDSNIMQDMGKFNLSYHIGYNFIKIAFVRNKVFYKTIFCLV